MSTVSHGAFAASEIVTFLVGPEKKLYNIHADLLDGPGSELPSYLKTLKDDSTTVDWSDTEEDYFNQWVSFRYTGNYVIELEDLPSEPLASPRTGGENHPSDVIGPPELHTARRLVWDQFNLDFGEYADHNFVPPTLEDFGPDRIVFSKYLKKHAAIFYFASEKGLYDLEEIAFAKIYLTLIHVPLAVSHVARVVDLLKVTHTRGGTPDSILRQGYLNDTLRQYVMSFYPDFYYNMD